MKEKLIILSDIEGFSNCCWIKYYSEFLIDRYDITLVDSLQLAEIEMESPDSEDIHSWMIERGIDKAVQNLTKNFNCNCVAIGFSIGGTILWKSMLVGCNFTKLMCISSTRLRYESRYPDSPTLLVYGSQDPYKPNEQWFVGKKSQWLFIDGVHNFYREVGTNRDIIIEIEKFLISDGDKNLTSGKK